MLDNKCFFTGVQIGHSIRYLHKTIVFAKLKLRCDIKSNLYIYSNLIWKTISACQSYIYECISIMLAIWEGMAEPRCHLTYHKVLLSLAPKFISNVFASLCLCCHHPCPCHHQVSHLCFCTGLPSPSSLGYLHFLLITAIRSSYKSAQVVLHCISDKLQNP